MGDYEWQERQRRNNRSRNRAGHFREEWTKDETDFLMDEFPAANGHAEQEAALAELLGRTIEACRQHYYCVRRGTARVVTSKTTTTTTASTTYIGAFDDPEDRWWETS